MIFAADDPLNDDPRPTALFAAAAGSASANSWTSVNGWSVARVYSNVAEEYEAAHTRVGVVDTGPIVRYTARGREAGDFLARAISAPVASLEPGESARGLILDQSGAVADIVETARLGPDLYLLSASRRHARRLQLAARGLDVSVEDITGHVAALALIGPTAREAAAAAGLDLSADMLAAQLRVRGVETSARPIRYGALAGVEVIFPFEEALTLWERLKRAARPRAIGLDALEIIRIEGGGPRTGVDFVSADDARRDDEKRLPSELGLAHLAPSNRAWFNGRRALRLKSEGARALTVLGLDAAAAAAGAAVFCGKAEVGRITSCAFSPRLKRMVAFADLAADAVKKPLEVALPPDRTRAAAADGRAAAERLETAEGRLADAFRAGEARATDSPAPAV